MEAIKLLEEIKFLEEIKLLKEIKLLMLKEIKLLKELYIADCSGNLTCILADLAFRRLKQQNIGQSDLRNYLVKVFNKEIIVESSQLGGTSLTSLLSMC